MTLLTGCRESFSLGYFFLFLFLVWSACTFFEIVRQKILIVCEKIETKKLNLFLKVHFFQIFSLPNGTRLRIVVFASLNRGHTNSIFLCTLKNKALCAYYLEQISIPEHRLFFGAECCCTSPQFHT